MNVSIRWSEAGSDPTASKMSFSAKTGSGHIVNMDGAPVAPGETLGGMNYAPRPMELVLAGTGGCTAYDVVMILKRARQDIADCEVLVNADRALTDPKVFTAIHFHFVVRGRALKSDAVGRAIQLSHEKYCSASVMLAKTAVLTHSFEIIETGTTVAA